MSDISEELVKFIDKYTQAKNHSLMTLSAQSKVSYATVRRLAQKEQTPTLSTLISLLNTIDPKETIPFIQKFWPDKVAASFIGKYGKKVDCTLLSGIDASPVLEVLFLAHKQSGMCLKEITKQFGEKGNDAIELLRELKLVQIENGRAIAENVDFSDPELTLQLISGTIRLAHKPSASRGLGFQIHGLNEDGLNNATKLFAKFMDDVLDLSKNQKFRGDITMVLSSILQTITGIILLLGFTVTYSSPSHASGSTIIGSIENARFVLTAPAEIKSEIQEISVSENVLNSLKHLTPEDAGILNINGNSHEIRRIELLGSGGVIIGTVNGKRMLVTAND
jgi:hypothetical protein